MVEQIFHREADIYPAGFKHDVTLIKPNSPSSVDTIQSLVSGLGWLCEDSWHSLRQRTSSLGFVGLGDEGCSAKTLRTSRPSDILIVGEGIFRNQGSASTPVEDHDLSTWKDLVSRAVLYRVYPDLDPQNGYSGVALYADGKREDGTEGPGIVGFQNTAQRSGQVHNFQLEGEALDARLRLGRVAFYGAFQIPEALRSDYTIA